MAVIKRVFYLGIALILGIMVSALQAAGLNDTGINSCANETDNNLVCPVIEFSGQDAEYGRDNAAATPGTLNKMGGGAAGFDFTKISNSGAELPANAILGDGAHDWACTRDNVTGLMWEIKTSDASLRDQNKTYTFANADDYITSVNAISLCGFDDWRLPSVKELLGIVHYGRYEPAIDSDYFLNTPNEWFWSGSPAAHHADGAWLVHFGYGIAGYYLRTSNAFVRLVRGGNAPDIFIDNGDSAVTQTNTGLMWSKCSEGQTGMECSGVATAMTWSEALTAAHQSRVAGYSDWRVPSIKELQSLFDYSHDTQTIYFTHFAQTPRDYFWSSSPYVATNATWLMSFNDGTIERYLTLGSTGLVRLVRNTQPINSAALDHSRLNWQVAEIYIATLGYAPDNEGLQYWVNNLLVNHWTPTEVAQSFFDQPLVKALYPSTLNHDALIDALYQNLFGRAADDAGKTYWLEQLQRGAITRNQMIIALINGGWANPDAAVDMAQFGNKVAVGLAFTDQQMRRGIIYSDLSSDQQTALRRIGAQIIAAVTDEVATRDAAINSIAALLDAL